jgi:histidinol-phosphate aminotransferase
VTTPRLNPDLLKVPLYIAGRSVGEVKEELGLEEVIKLASNESPVGPSPMALEAGRQMFQEAHRYPGACERDLRLKLASRLGQGLTGEEVTLANGGTDALRIISQAFVFDGGNTIMSRTTFPMYRILTMTFGGEVREVPPRPDYGHDLAAMAERIDGDTRLVFLCSPNNPSGHILTQDEADGFMARVPGHVVTVFDESYYDFVDDGAYADSLAYVMAGRNVLVVRSFSKSAGLANMRVGYIAGPPDLIGYINHARLPFHVGDIALAAAAASLDDHEYLARSRQAVAGGREWLQGALEGLGLDCLASQANFVTVVDPPMDPQALADALLRLGVIVRAMGSFGMPNGLRVSVGSSEANRRLIEALERVLS